MIEYDSIDVTPSSSLNYGSAALSSIEILSTAMSIQSASESHSINVTNIVLGSILLLANRVSGPVFQVLLKVKLGSLFPFLFKQIASPSQENEQHLHRLP